MRKLLALAFLAALPATSQVTCSISAVPLLSRTNGASEQVSDLVLTCVNDPAAFVNTLINIQIFLNTNITSRITNPVTSDTEALLLIDDPLPGVPNTSNGCPYFGQVLGTPFISNSPVCMPGTGNVYQAKLAFGAGGVVLNNSLVWAGVPFVGGTTRTLRITNIHADASLLGGGAIMSFISITSSASFTLSGQPTFVGQPLDGLKLTSLPSGKGTLVLRFQEQFSSAFKKRIENTILGPLTASYQDVPGTLYCTESGFTPEFTSLAPGDIGSATTGTRLLAHFAGLPPPITSLVVPNAVTSSSGELVAHFVIPPLGSDFAGGTVTTGGGSSVVVVSSTHTADLLYEVTAAAPFLGKHGCFVIEHFDVPVTTSFPGPVPPSAVTGRLAPIDGTGVASATAPEPRFVP